MAQLHFDEHLIKVFDGEGLDTYAIEEALAGILHEGGYVKESYASALHEREKVFPTALDVGGINVAIPHCDTEHVNRGALCVGVLKHPVTWRRMDDGSKTCEVSLVVMLALDEAHAHLEMLQKVIGLIQDQELVAAIIACDDQKKIYDLCKDKLAV